MNGKKQTVISIVALFMFILIYEMLLNGYVLAGLYQQTSAIWRQPEEMKKYLPLCLVIHLAIALVIVSFYSKYRAYNNNYCGAKRKAEISKPCSRMRGICFGVSIGLLFGLPHTLAFVMLPVPAFLAVGWLAGELIEGIFIGLILSFTMPLKEEINE